MGTQGADRHPLPQLVQDWLSWLSAIRNVSPGTITSYRSDLRALARFMRLNFGTTDVRGLTLPQLQAFFVDLEARGLGECSRIGALTTVRGLFRWLLATGQITQDFTPLLARPRATRSLPRYMTEREVDQLLDFTRGTDMASVRLHTILQVLYATAMRVTELSCIRIIDVDLARAQIRVMGKGRVERYCNFHPEARSVIADWLVRRRGWLIAKGWEARDDGALFINFRDGTRLRRESIEEIVKKAGQDAGIEQRVHPHLFRHSCLTHMHEHGAKLLVLKELAGHASIATTQIYTHVTDGLRAKEYLNTHPRAGGPLRRASEA